jgi:hypothetical protein
VEGIMSKFRLACGACVLALTVVSAAAAEPKEVKLEKTWSGEVAIELKKEAPASGFLADKEAFAKLWKAYRGKEDLPEIDFSKELVLVAVNNDPNKISIVAKLDDKGDLKVVHASTLIGFINPKTCAYQFALIKREGIRTIGGKPITK